MQHTSAQLAEIIQQNRYALNVELTSLENFEKQQAKSKTHLETLEKVQALFQKVAAETQDQLKFCLEDLVQSALDAVFPATYDFRMEFVPKRGKTEAEIYLEKDNERIDPMESSGGGVVDIVAFALRIATWSIGTTTNTLILDEPFKWLSAGLRPLAGDILSGLSKRLNIQIIMVTHDEEMIRIADRIHHVTQKQRRSILTTTEGALYND